MHSTFNWKRAITWLLGLMITVSGLNFISGLMFTNRLIDYRLEAQNLDTATDAAKSIQFEISQIQQFLTDVSATGERGGFEEAATHYQTAIKALDTITLSRPEDAAQLAEIKSGLIAFNTAGKNMAETYLSKGQAAGNSEMKMPGTGFDAQAATLIAKLNDYLTPLNAKNEDTKQALSKQISHLRTSIAVINFLAALGLVALVLFMGKKLLHFLGGNPNVLSDAVHAISEGNLNADLHLKPNDTTSVLAFVANMQATLRAGVASKIENARTRAALDATTTSIMIADADRNIVYINPAQAKLLAEVEADIRKDLPQFNARAVIGVNIDDFHKNPTHQRTLLAQLRSTHVARLTIGGRRFKLVMNPIVNTDGTPAGTVVEWADETDMLALREREVSLATERSRISAALEGTSVNVMIADTNRTIIYMNAAVTRMLRVAESDLRKALPNFSVDKVLGGSMDAFHRNPSHQANLLGNLNSTYEAKIAVGGRHFRLIANPIRNEAGERLGTVVEWLDITREVAIEKEVSDIIQAAALGDFKQRIPMADKDGFFKLLAENMNTLMATSDQGLAEVVRMLGALAGGDLTERITNDYSGTFGQLKDDSNATAEKLTNIISQIKEATDAIGTAAQEIASGNQNLSQRTESQAASLEETASSMEELTSTVKQNAENAKHANQLARGASDIAIKGGGVVEQVVTTMREINDSAKKIVDIIGVIDGIAFQTNILALNAAVEAARAGEQGRGFAVVASEVRNLAQRSAAAAKEIKSLIGDSVDKVESGSKLVDEAGRTMGEVVTAVKRVTDIMSEISAASVEQSAGIEQVNTTITQMDDMTQQNAALVEQAAAAAESMEEQSQSLSMAVAAFRLSEDAGRSMMPARRSATALPAPKASTSKVKAKSLPKPKADGDDWEEF